MQILFSANISCLGVRYHVDFIILHQLFRYGTYLNQSLLIQEFCLYLCLLIKSIPWVSFIKSTRHKESEDQAQKYILKNQITIFFTLFLSLTERVLRFQIHMSRATHKFQNTSLRVVILFAISHYYITKATPLQNSIFFFVLLVFFSTFFLKWANSKLAKTTTFFKQ